MAHKQGCGSMMQIWHQMCSNMLAPKQRQRCMQAGKKCQSPEFKLLLQRWQGLKNAKLTSNGGVACRLAMNMLAKQCDVQECNQYPHRHIAPAPTSSTGSTLSACAGRVLITLGPLWARLHSAWLGFTRLHSAWQKENGTRLVLRLVSGCIKAYLCK
mgnify:CR=1 FL=1